MSNKKPTHRVYAVKDRGEGKKAHWIEIGAAWLHQDGDGFSLNLKLQPPPDAELVMRKIKPKAGKPAVEGAAQ